MSTLLIVIQIASFVLFANDLRAVVALYRGVGVPLIDEDHDEGPVHGAAETRRCFAIYQAEEGVGARAPSWCSATSDLPGFYVESVDVVGRSLGALGARMLATHQRRPWGCRIVVEDPDGRAVEVNQQNHCV